LKIRHSLKDKILNKNKKINKNNNIMIKILFIKNKKKQLKVMIMNLKIINIKSKSKPTKAIFIFNNFPMLIRKFSKNQMKKMMNYNKKIIKINQN
jgi:hypothetical protein